MTKLMLLSDGFEIMELPARICWIVAELFYLGECVSGNLPFV